MTGMTLGNALLALGHGDTTRDSIHASTLSRSLNSMALMTAAGGKLKEGLCFNLHTYILLTPRYFASSPFLTQRRRSAGGWISPNLLSSCFGLLAIWGLQNCSGGSLYSREAGS